MPAAVETKPHRDGEELNFAIGYENDQTARDRRDAWRQPRHQRGMRTLLKNGPNAAPGEQYVAFLIRSIRARAKGKRALVAECNR